MKRVQRIVGAALLCAWSAPAYAGTNSSTTTAASSTVSASAGDDATATPDKAPPKKDRLRDVLAGLDHTGSPEPPPRESEAPPASAAPGEERPMPNYSQRDPESVTAGDVLIWVPRAALYPVHLTMEYLVRYPVVRGMTWLEDNKVFKRIEDWLTWRDGKSGVFPVFLADLGLRPTIGLSTFHQDIFLDGNDFNASVATGGANFLSIAGRNDTLIFDDDSGRVRLFGNFLTRPDLPFYGTGPLTSTDDEAFYRTRRVGAGAEFQALLTGLSRVQLSATFRDVEFLANETKAPSIESIFLNAALPSGIASAGLPPGYLEPNGSTNRYQIIETRLTGTLDTRHPDREFFGGSGLRAQAFGSFSFDPSQTDISYFKWGGEAAGFLDLTGLNHVIALRVYAEAFEEAGDEIVPFTELISLGGLDRMRGYLPNRFLGESAFETTLSYRYPVWSLLDAEMFASMGNVYNGFFEELSFKRMYLNGGINLRTSFERDSGFMVLFAVGTNRLDQDDVKVDSVRFAFGVYQGF